MTQPTPTPAGWSGYLKSRSSDGVTATINVVLLRGLIEATEANIRADERERLVKLAVEQDRGTIPPVGSSRPSNALIAACWLRSQGNN
jgi:hypothetical protein